MRCEHCKKEIPEKSSFCLHCGQAQGQKLNKASQQLPAKPNAGQLSPAELQEQLGAYYAQRPGPEVHIPRMETTRAKERRKSRELKLKIVLVILAVLCMVGILLSLRYYLQHIDTPRLSSYVTHELGVFHSELEHSDFKKVDLPVFSGAEFELYANRTARKSVGDKESEAIEVLRSNNSLAGRLKSQFAAGNTYGHLPKLKKDESLLLAQEFSPQVLETMKLRVPTGREAHSESRMAQLSLVTDRTKAKSVTRKLAFSQGLLENADLDDYLQNTTRQSEQKEKAKAASVGLGEIYVYKGILSTGAFWCVLAIEQYDLAYISLAVSDNVELINSFEQKAQESFLK